MSTALPRAHGLLAVLAGFWFLAPVHGQARQLPAALDNLHRPVITLEQPEEPPAQPEKLPPPRPGDAVQETPEEKRIRKIVTDTLKEQEEEKKKKEEAQKQQQKLEEQQKKAEADARGVAVGSDLNFKAVWKDGLFFETPNKDFSMHIGARFDADAAWFGAGQKLQSGPGGVGELGDGALWRRARIRMDGSNWEIINWVAEFDFATAIEDTNKLPAVIDLYTDVTHLPVVGDVRGGYFREPDSMESLTSENAFIFMERSAAFVALVPFRHMGVMLYDSVLNERVGWAAGIFRSDSRSTGNDFDVGDGEYAFTGRLTCLPWYSEDGRSLLHLGAAYSHRSIGLHDDDKFQFKTTPSVAVGPYIFADTGKFAAQSEDFVNLEAAVKLGALVVQSEYYQVWVHDAQIDDVSRNPTFYGWYVQASYMLTGEERAYRKVAPATNIGVFDRIHPNENFFFVQSGEQGPWWRRLCLGRGAWEVAARYCYLNLNDPSQGVNAQTYQDVTLALNWYLTTSTRIQLNYIIANRDFPKEDNRGTAQILGIRFHNDF